MRLSPLLPLLSVACVGREAPDNGTAVDADGDGVPWADSGGLDCDDADPDAVGEDLDNDGIPACLDCDDADPGVSPLATEVCDGRDTDCDGRVDQAADGLGACTQDFVASNRLDLLFVIDNSGTMGEEQAALSLASRTLTDEQQATGIDYHLGVVSTDMNDSAHSGRLNQHGGMRWVEPNSPDADYILESMIELGIDGSSVEAGLDAAHAALLPPPLAVPGGYNDGFRRTDADLGVVFVSDESDFSSQYPTPADLQTELGAVVGNLFRLKLHAIVSPDPICVSAATPGWAYEQLALDTDGVTADICLADWDQVVADIVHSYEPHHLGVYGLGVDVLEDSLAVDITTTTAPT